MRDRVAGVGNSEWREPSSEEARVPGQKEAMEARGSLVKFLDSLWMPGPGGTRKKAHPFAYVPDADLEEAERLLGEVTQASGEVYVVLPPGFKSCLTSVIKDATGPGAGRGRSQYRESALSTLTVLLGARNQNVAEEKKVFKEAIDGLESDLRWYTRLGGGFFRHHTFLAESVRKLCAKKECGDDTLRACCEVSDKINHLLINNHNESGNNHHNQVDWRRSSGALYQIIKQFRRNVSEGAEKAERICECEPVARGEVYSDLEHLYRSLDYSALLFKDEKAMDDHGKVQKLYADKKHAAGGPAAGKTAPAPPIDDQSLAASGSATGKAAPTPPVPVGDEITQGKKRSQQQPRVPLARGGTWFWHDRPVGTAGGGESERRVELGPTKCAAKSDDPSGPAGGAAATVPLDEGVYTVYTGIGKHPDWRIVGQGVSPFGGGRLERDKPTSVTAEEGQGPRGPKA